MAYDRPIPVAVRFLRRIHRRPAFCYDPTNGRRFVGWIVGLYTRQPKNKREGRMNNTNNYGSLKQYNRIVSPDVRVF